MVPIDHNNNTAVTNSSTATSSENSFGTPVSDLTDCRYNYPHVSNQQDCFQVNQSSNTQLRDSFISPTGYSHHATEFQAAAIDHQQINTQWMNGGNFSDNLWNIEDMWFLQQQLHNNNNVV
ncbi:putative E3 ubiquitin-protein ligase UPL6-like [Capsicum annuum]|nr:putative E3 ubiquitin-protein ligase UPL6-like [Capsicum annuum]KAF3642967.1 putative E3 ubiquitin-protein ligase UPL6-like [Capsicum annuum]